MFIKSIVERIRGRRRENVKVEIEELKKALLEDPRFRDEILKELEYRTGRRDFLKISVLGLLGALGIAESVRSTSSPATPAPTVSSNTAREIVSDYSGVKIPKPCTCIVAQDGTGDYDVSPGEDASEVIQKAIDYAHKKGGGEVRVREGEYLVDNSLHLYFHYTSLNGMGAGATIIRANSKISNILDLTKVPNGSFLRISNLKIDGNNLASKCIDDSKLRTAPSVHEFYNLWIVGAIDCLVDITNREGTRFEHCVFGEKTKSNTKIGLKCDNLGGLLRINDCLFQYISEIKISFKGLELYIRGSSFAGGDSDLAHIYLRGNGTRVRIDQCWFEGITKSPAILGDISDPPSYIEIHSTNFSAQSDVISAIEGKVETLLIVGSKITNTGKFKYSINIKAHDVCIVDLLTNKSINFNKFDKYIIRTSGLKKEWYTNLKNMGVAIIPAGKNSVIVNHKLCDKPTTVIVTPTANLGSVWVSEITPKSFKINCSNAPKHNVEVYWYAEV